MYILLNTLCTVLETKEQWRQIMLFFSALLKKLTFFSLRCVINKKIAYLL